MCGICGAIQVSGERRLPVDVVTLNRMTDVMTHRGPNDRGTYLAAGAGLGARRLSIVDVEGGHQPFANEDGRVHAVQNGELYNHPELRRELERDGHRFASRCDTEILPHLFERYGTRFVEHLRGKFALAVWDGERRRAVIARDRLGIKPLYYAQVGDLLLFGSELKSVLASGLVTPDLDLEALDAYLTLGFVPAPRTPLLAVQKLLPGEQLVIEDGKLRRERYWRFPDAQPERGRTASEWAEELLAALDESVRLRLMSDVPLGAMLSGGLDSSLIVALMSRHVSEPVKTFSIGFEEAGAENELAQAREVAALFGTDHHELELSFARQDVDLAELSWFMDEPVADLSSLGFLALSKLAAETVTVALSGQGADELLGGYSRHRNARLASYVQGLPPMLRGLVSTAAGHAPSRFQGVAAVIRGRDAAERQLGAFAGARRDLATAIAGGPFAELDGVYAARSISDRLEGTTSRDPLATMLFLDGQLGLVDDMLHYFDRTSMAHSLEVRVPFLDHHVVELAARIPTELKVRRLTTKHLLKQAARGILPDHIIDRPKVGFFNAAVGSWFKAQTRGVISDYLLADQPAYAEFLDRDAVSALVRSHEHRPELARALLPVLMLEIWLTEFLPRALAPTVVPELERVAG